MYDIKPILECTNKSGETLKPGDMVRYHTEDYICIIDCIYQYLNDGSIGLDLESIAKDEFGESVAGYYNCCPDFVSKDINKLK